MRLARRALTSLATCLALGAISTGVALGGEPISIGADTSSDANAEVDVDLTTDADVLVQSDLDAVVDADVTVDLAVDANAELDVTLGNDGSAVVDVQGTPSTLNANVILGSGGAEAAVVDIGAIDGTVEIGDDAAAANVAIATETDTIGGAEVMADVDVDVDADVAVETGGHDGDGATVLVHAPVIIDATADELLDADAAAEVCIAVGILANAPACDAWAGHDNGGTTPVGDGISAVIDGDGALDAAVDDLVEADVLADVCLGVGIFDDAPGCGIGGAENGGTTPDGYGITALLVGDGSLDAAVDDLVEAGVLADVCLGVGIFDDAPECHGVLSGGGNAPDEGTSPGSGNVGADGTGPGFATGPAARTTDPGHAMPAERTAGAGTIPDTATGVTNQLALWSLMLLLFAAALGSRARRQGGTRS